MLSEDSPRLLICCKGLPASGKSSWARQFILDNPDWKIVNKDSLREMLDMGRYSSENEMFVVEMRDAIIAKALIKGFNVIVDDTNLSPKHTERISSLLEQIGTNHGITIGMSIKDFTDVPLEECILRDSRRPRPVGEKVIRQLHAQHMAPKVEAPVDMDV